MINSSDNNKFNRNISNENYKSHRENKRKSSNELFNSKIVYNSKTNIDVNKKKKYKNSENIKSRNDSSNANSKTSKSNNSYFNNVDLDAIEKNN